MEGLALAGAAVAGLGGDVGLEPDDRIDAALLRFPVEIERAIEGAVVRHRDGFHPQFLRAIEELRDPGHSVEKRKFGMRV